GEALEPAGERTSCQLVAPRRRFTSVSVPPSSTRAMPITTSGTEGAPVLGSDRASEAASTSASSGTIEVLTTTSPMTSPGGSVVVVEPSPAVVVVPSASVVVVESSGTELDVVVLSSGCVVLVVEVVVD